MVDDRDSEAATRAEPLEFEGTYEELGPGTEVGGYVIDGELGHGGMGVVYEATHPVIGKRAAIKVLRAEVSSSPVTLERFIQEARAVNQIGHPNIIDIFAFGALPDGRAYHVMDLLVGESLRKRVKRGPLHPSEAASVIGEITSALMAAHDKGFVHRDLKPDNVFLIEREGTWPEVKLLDFGLAKLMPEAGVSAFRTKTGVMLGTPEYMSPEQARGIGVDHRTDVYALGVLMFEILSGRRPFATSGDSFAMLQAHAEQPPPPLSSLVADLPDEMVQLVDAMLAKDAGARPSLEAVRTVIKRLRSNILPSQSVAAMEIPHTGVAKRVDPSMSTKMTASRAVVAADEHDAVVTVGPPRSKPPTASQPPRAKPTTVSPSGSGAGHGSGSQHPVTTFGVPPPPNRVKSRRMRTVMPPVSRTLLILGALLAIGAGIAIAIVLVGT